MADQTPEQIARKYGEMESIPGDEKVSVQGGLLPLITLSRAYLALPAPLREPCGTCGGEFNGLFLYSNCKGSGSVLTEDGKRMEEIQESLNASSVSISRTFINIEWLLDRLTAALNEIERMKRNANL